MCGIVGISGEHVERYKDNLSFMVSSLIHRGPDENGTTYFSNCILGHTRLSIIDLKTGRQPMLSQDKKLAVTFNGEIYGYKELRRSLDYHFQTTSDTEVLIALYRKYGPEMVERLPGMFAFAIWDNENQSLFCARDRFGEKPFYYAFGKNGELIFGSEIKTILASKLIEPKLNQEALSHYLQTLYVHPMQSIYTNVYTLPPGHCITYRKQSVAIRKYWQLPVTNNTLSLYDATEQFRSLLERSVKKQLVADVPVGAFLSGGLDSSTIVSIASDYSADLKTFSFGFEGNETDILYARDVARKYKTEHIELTDKSLRIDDLLIQMQSVYDEPFADSSNIPTYLVAKLASEHVKVVLSGDGADELLAGYSFWYRPLLSMEEQMCRKGKLQELFYFLLLAIKKFELFGRNKSHNNLMGVDLFRKTDSISHAHCLQKQYFTDTELQQLGIKAWRPPVDICATNTVDDALRTDLLDYMPGDILVKIDRASMANGVELRAPFLDVDFASLCISLPYCMKINRSRDKEILRQAYSMKWPEPVRRRSKLGFGAPVPEWLAREEVKMIKRDYLSDPNKKIHSILDLNNNAMYASKDTYKTWILLVLSIWLEQHRF